MRSCGYFYIRVPHGSGVRLLRPLVGCKMSVAIAIHPDRRREGFLSKSVLLIMLREAYTVRMPYAWIPIFHIGSITTAFELMAIFQD